VLDEFGESLRSTDEVVIEATGNSLALSRVLTPFVSRVIIANLLQVKAIAQAHVKIDKIDAARSPACTRPGMVVNRRGVWAPIGAPSA